MHHPNDIGLPIQQHWINNKAMCDYGVQLARGHKELPVLRFECYDKGEVAEINTYMHQQYPDIKFYCTWLSFK